MPQLAQLVRYTLDEADAAVMAIREISMPSGTTCAAVVVGVVGDVANLQVLIDRDTPAYYTTGRTEGTEEGQPGTWVSAPAA